MSAATCALELMKSICEVVGYPLAPLEKALELPLQPEEEPLPCHREWRPNVFRCGKLASAASTAAPEEQPEQEPIGVALGEGAFPHETSLDFLHQPGELGECGLLPGALATLHEDSSEERSPGPHICLDDSGVWWIAHLA